MHWDRRPALVVASVVRMYSIYDALGELRDVAIDPQRGFSPPRLGSRRGVGRRRRSY